MRRKYKDEAEAKAAMKAYQAAYRALRKSGQWVRKYKKRQDKGESAEQLAKCREEHAAELAEKRARREALAKMTPEERQAAIRERNRQTDAAYRERRRAHITEYNRMYRQRTRDAKASPEVLKKRLERRALIHSLTPAGIIEHAVKAYATAHGQTPDEVTERAVGNGAIEAMLRSLEPTTDNKTRRIIARRVAPNVFSFFMDPETAVMDFKRTVYKKRGDKV